MAPTKKTATKKTTRTKVPPMPLPDAHTRRLIAVRSTSHTETVDAYFRGKAVRSVSRARIEQALRELGLDALIVPATGALALASVGGALALAGMGPR